MDIRPVSDLRNKYTEIEQALETSNEIFLTKNGYGASVIMSVEAYSKLTGTTPLPPRKRKKHTKSARGILHDLANPELRKMEKDAGRLHAIQKFGKGGVL